MRSISEGLYSGHHDYIGWVGATQRSDSADFVWGNGEAVDSSLWCQGEPNDYGSIEDHVTLIIHKSGSNGVHYPCLNDFSNTFVAHCLCEY